MEKKDVDMFIPEVGNKNIIYKTHCRVPQGINGDFQLYLFMEQLDNAETKEHLAFVMGNIRDQLGVLIHIHSACPMACECSVCDCQDQIQTALDMIKREKKGALLYLRNTDVGIGRDNKLKDYQLSEHERDIIEVNTLSVATLTHRQYYIAAVMIKYLGIKSIALIYNNADDIIKHGIEVSKWLPRSMNPSKEDKIDILKIKQKEIEEQEYPLSYPSLFIENASISKASRENTEFVTKKLISKFGNNISCILFQGSNMRGDGSIHHSDFDYICIFQRLTPAIITAFSEIKTELPRNNFLYLSEEEYHIYPKDARLQFFITRRVFGNFDLGKIPTRKDILHTAIKYALQLKDVIRPLLFEFINNPKDQSLLNQAYVALKRVDDCFMRVICLYITGKYPLHRDHLKNIAQGESVNNIIHIIESWYSGNVSGKKIFKALITADRLLNIFLRMSQRNKI